MILTILLIIAVWFIPSLPLAIQILITVFGSLRVLIILIRGIYKACHKDDDREVNELIKRYLPRH